MAMYGVLILYAKFTTKFGKKTAIIGLGSTATLYFTQISVVCMHRSQGFLDSNMPVILELHSTSGRKAQEITTSCTTNGQEPSLYLLKRYGDPMAATFPKQLTFDRYSPQRRLFKFLTVLEVGQWVIWV